MREELMLRLADGLEADAVNPTGIKFDLRLWGGPADKADHYYYHEKPEVVEASCNTMACAMGFAAISGLFKDEGLIVSYIELPSLAGHRYMLQPECRGQEGMLAAAELFGISHHDATYLFDPECYAVVPKGADGERFVAQRIRDFVAGKVDTSQHPDERYRE